MMAMAHVNGACLCMYFYFNLCGVRRPLLSLPFLWDLGTGCGFLRFSSTGMRRATHNALCATPGRDCRAEWLQRPLLLS